MTERMEEIREWRPAGMAVRQIRTWIAEEKRAHGGAAPPWTHVFAERLGAGARDVRAGPHPLGVLAP